MSFKLRLNLTLTLTPTYTSCRRWSDVSISPALPFRAAWWTAGTLQHPQRKAHDLQHVTLQRLRCWIQQDNKLFSFSMTNLRERSWATLRNFRVLKYTECDRLPVCAGEEVQSVTSTPEETQRAKLVSQLLLQTMACLSSTTQVKRTF